MAEELRSADGGASGRGGGGGVRPEDCVEVTVRREGPLFIRLKLHRGYVVVNNFDPTPDGEQSEVEESGLIKPGDALIAVNDTSLEGLSFRAAIKRIKNATHPRVLRFLRRRAIPGEFDGSKNVSTVLVSNSLRESRVAGADSGQTGGSAFASSGAAGGADASSAAVFDTSTVNDPDSPSRRMQVAREMRFRTLLAAGTDALLNEPEIRTLAAQGIPEGKGLRGVLWRFMLGYIPEDRSLWDDHLTLHRTTYAEFVREYRVEPSELRALMSNSSNDDAHTDTDKVKNFEDSPPAKSENEEMPGGGNDGKDATLGSDPPNESEGVIAPPEDCASAADSGTRTSEQEENGMDTREQEPNSGDGDGGPGSMSSGGHGSVNEPPSKSHLTPVAPEENPLNVEEGSRWKQYFEDSTLMEEIQKDVIRTHPELHFFLDDPEQERYKCMERILFVYAKLHPGVRYVQGMNEILGTIYYVFATDEDEEWSKHAEADSFYCFTKIMSEMGDVYIRTLDHSTTGLGGRIRDFVMVLRRHDPRLFAFMESQQIDPSFYSLRWITTLLSREFDLPDTIRLWDTLFADTNRHELLTYMCTAMVLAQKEAIVHGDFATNLRLLQSYPPSDVLRLLSRAIKMRREDQMAAHPGKLRSTTHGAQVRTTHDTRRRHLVQHVLGTPATPEQLLGAPSGGRGYDALGGDSVEATAGELIRNVSASMSRAASAWSTGLRSMLNQIQQQSGTAGGLYAGAPGVQNSIGGGSGGGGGGLSGGGDVGGGLGGGTGSSTGLIDEPPLEAIPHAKSQAGAHGRDMRELVRGDMDMDDDNTATEYMAESNSAGTTPGGGGPQNAHQQRLLQPSFVGQGSPAGSGGADDDNQELDIKLSPGLLSATGSQVDNAREKRAASSAASMRTLMPWQARDDRRAASTGTASVAASSLSSQAGDRSLGAAESPPPQQAPSQQQPQLLQGEVEDGEDSEYGNEFSQP